MNAFIELIAQNNMSKLLYDIFFALGFVFVFLCVFYLGMKMKIKAWKTAIVVLTVYPAVVLWMFVLYWIETGFFGGNNIVRVFVYVPLITYPVAKLLKIPFKEALSMVALGPVAVHGVSHLGCMFEGCCHGYIQQWGLYNRTTGCLHFPTQPIEAIIALLILAYLLIRAKKRKYVPDGLEYPIMLMVFGSTRFLCEFLRDNDKLIWGISNLAFHALFMFVVGMIWIIVAKRKKKKEQPLAVEEAV
jgi:phosphatidylglycerol:prolipoprotein diacylglycerol transferase